MQYFQALKIGQSRSREAAMLLKKYTGNALPAITLKDSKNGNWEPVGEENYVGVFKGEYGNMICICDKNGNAKAIASWYNDNDTKKIIDLLIKDGFAIYNGKIKVPL